MRKAAKRAGTLSSKTTSTKSVKNDDLSGRVIAYQLLDTSWRVALPIIALCYIGIRIDNSHNTAPLFTLIGLFLSLATSTFLVYRQIQSLYPDFFKWKENK